ncbi:MAG: signal recognition particle protein [Planctomycetes bacterium]|nr:signal recognition particle protein [Planctomycetota bacterium]
MFDQLTDTLGGAISRLTSRGKLTAGNMDEGLREVRKALLEADVSIAVVREFMDRVKTKAIGQLQVKGVDPGQQVVKVVHDELTALMGPIDTRIRESEQAGEPTIVMLIGLQGSGKTTTCGKLSKYLVEKKKKKPLLVAADLQRPAAIDQLKVLGESLGIPVFSEKPVEKRGLTGLFKRGSQAAQVCAKGIEHAKQTGRDVVILDTAGRLHIDEDLMKELQEIRKRCSPHNVFLVCDAMTGQDAVNSAKQFNDEMSIDGVILTKMDGDARGGAALSVKAVTGKTIKFVGTGEKLEKLEEFHPERMAGRILDMGDVVSLVEKAQEVVDQKQAEKSATRLMSGRFNFEDFLQQLNMLKKMGPLKGLMKMIPGMGQIMKHAQVEMTGDELKPIEAIIQSMTRDERKNPELLSGRTGGSRRRRIAKGSGADINEVNGLIKQFKAMKRMITEMTQGGGLGQLMTAQGVQDMVPRMPGGRALEKKLREAGVSRGPRGPRPKRNKNKKRRRR